MNIDIVKNEINRNIGKKVKITIHGMRNKIEFYEGNIYRIYPNIFTISSQYGEKSFTYRDVITKDITIKYL